MSEAKQVPRMPCSAGDVKKNHYIILKNRPVKVSEVRTSKTGKHGHAKANITGSCVLTSQKCNEVFPASAGLTAFTLEKRDYLVSDVEKLESGFKISALDDDNEEVFFYTQPNNENCKGGELAAAVAAKPDTQFLITVIRAPVEISDNEFRDEELIEAFREDKGAK